MRRLVAFGLAAALAGGAAPAAGSWNWTDGGACLQPSLDICVNFTLTQGAGNWVLQTAVTGSTGARLLAVGLYATEGTWTTTSNPIVSTNPSDWTQYYQGNEGPLNQLGGFVGANGQNPTSIFELGAKEGATDTYTLTITFTPPPGAETGTLLAAAHVGSFDQYEACSLFFGSDGSTNYAENAYKCGGSSVPEPVSLVLLGSGLLGLGGLRMRRRVRK